MRKAVCFFVVAFFFFFFLLEGLHKCLQVHTHTQLHTQTSHGVSSLQERTPSSVPDWVFSLSLWGLLHTHEAKKKKKEKEGLFVQRTRHTKQGFQPTLPQFDGKINIWICNAEHKGCYVRWFLIDPPHLRLRLLAQRTGHINFVVKTLASHVNRLLARPVLRLLTPNSVCVFCLYCLLLFQHWEFHCVRWQQLLTVTLARVWRQCTMPHGLSASDSMD